jgi:branched-subunit amino acid aminotransferase/4-amino-4-deoxychorismate lyase
MSEIDRAEIDGAPATPEEMERTTSTFGHFTAMQVRNGATRGLSFHLRRLAESNGERFGAGLDPDRVRELIRHVLDGVGDASVRVHLYAASPEPRVVVTVKPPSELPSPQRLRSVRYQRPEPHVKHVATEQGRYRERVQREAYDDALLTGDNGIVSETSMTNIEFFDGDEVVWPDAPHLRGITMQLLEERLPGRGVVIRRERVRVSGIGSLDGAFLSNARGLAAVSSIDDVDLPARADRMELLADVYDSVPWDPI